MAVPGADVHDVTDASYHVPGMHTDELIVLSYHEPVDWQAAHGLVLTISLYRTALKRTELTKCDLQVEYGKVDRLEQTGIRNGMPEAHPGVTRLATMAISIQL